MSAPQKASEPLDTSLPHIRQIQRYIREKQSVEVKLLNGDTFSGQLIWQDPDCMCVKQSNEITVLLWRHALAYLTTSGES